MFPGLGGRVVASTAPLHFLKTIEGLDVKLIPLIKHRKINLLLLLYVSRDVKDITKVQILDFQTLSKRCQSLLSRFKCVE